MIPPEPLFFGPAARPRFGWIHRPASGDARAGLIICDPFGYEAVCAHRSLRHFAEAVGAVGVAALRFDYDGTGDSAGSDRDPGRLTEWVTSIRDAIDTLRARTGVERIFVLGVRLGAALAVLAARDRRDVDGVIAFAPVVSGRAYLRELRALQMSLGIAAPPIGHTPSADEREAVGFVLTPETLESVGQIDLAKTDTRPARQVLLLERDDLPGPDAWATAMSEAGTGVTRLRLPGYASMVLDPHNAIVPEAVIRAATDWIANAVGTAAPRETPPPAAGDARRLSPASSIPEARIRHGEGTIRERAVFLDDDQLLFGIVAEREEPQAAPERPAPARLGILLLNAGAVHHIGPNRLYVEMARRWAALGHVVLRMDIAGIGDSRPRRAAAENVVYSPHALDDVAAAVAFLRRQPGVDRCLPTGLCAGAYHAFKAALAGLPVAAIMPINPLTFFWKEGMSLDYPAHKVIEEAHRYAESLFRPESWGKLLRGQGRPRVVAEVIARHGVALVARRIRDAARFVNRPLPDDLGHDLQGIARRRIPMHFVFAAGDPGFDLLRIQGGSTFPSLKGRHELTVDLIDGPDHTFTPVWSHPILLDRLTYLVRRVAG